jgi:Spx/MgsR family transcriptional regulator
MTATQNEPLKTVEVYGIPNCDTIKKALNWLKDNKIAVTFHDYKKEGISQKKLSDWCKLVGWETLLNKKSATWRGLSAEQQAGIINQAAAIELMMENNSIIKRPVVEVGKKILVGFNEVALKQELSNK